jgi:hypothetical protein
MLALSGTQWNTSDDLSHKTLATSRLPEPYDRSWNIDAIHRLDDLSQRSTEELERELAQLDAMRLLTAEARRTEESMKIDVEVDAPAVDVDEPFDAEEPFDEPEAAG